MTRCHKLAPSIRRVFVDGSEGLLSAWRFTSNHQSSRRRALGANPERMAEISQRFRLLMFAVSQNGNPATTPPALCNRSAALPLNGLELI